VANILTLPENDEVLVVGTVYKDMKLKPSILDEYVKVCLWIQMATHARTCCIDPCAHIMLAAAVVVKR